MKANSYPQLWMLLLLVFNWYRRSDCTCRLWMFSNLCTVHDMRASSGSTLPTLKVYCCCSWHSTGAGFPTLDSEEETALLPPNNVSRYLFCKIEIITRRPTLSSFLAFDWCRFPDPGRGSRFASSKQCLWIFDPHPRCERGWKKIEIEILCWTLRYLHRVRWETDLNVKPFLSFVSGSKILTQEVETNIWTT